MEEAHRMIRAIRQMEASLEDHKVTASHRPDSEELQVTLPLNGCLQGLKETYNTVAKLHRERFEQVKSRRFHLNRSYIC